MTNTLQKSESPRDLDVNVFTLVVWLGCLMVGALGYALPTGRPAATAKVELPPVEMVSVELAPNSPSDRIPPPQAAVALDVPTSREIPQPAAMARPSPSIAFALPVEGPARITDARNAVYSKRPGVFPVDAPAPQRLIFGQGEGRQPPPEYPLRAVREGEEGIVVVRMVVGEDGRVISAESSAPSPWPLLNESALRAVRERWHFSGGGLRVYEVAIRFELMK